MEQDAEVYSPAGLEPIVIGHGTEADLPAIVEVLNYTIMNSNATLATEPASVAERREWYERFAVTGPYQLFAARRGNEVLGYASSQPIGIMKASGRPWKSALHSASAGAARA